MFFSNGTLKFCAFLSFISIYILHLSICLPAHLSVCLSSIKFSGLLLFLSLIFVPFIPFFVYLFCLYLINKHQAIILLVELRAGCTCSNSDVGIGWEGTNGKLNWKFSLVIFQNVYRQFKNWNVSEMQTYIIIKQHWFICYEFHSNCKSNLRPLLVPFYSLIQYKAAVCTLEIILMENAKSATEYYRCLLTYQWNKLEAHCYKDFS